MLTHSRAKPFGCSQCNNTFTTAQNIYMHNAHPFVQKKGISDVSSATILEIVLVISRITSPRTLEKNSLPVKNAITLAVTQIVWSVTCFHTLVRYLLPVSNATTPANDLINWRCTWRSTVQKQIHEQECKNAQMGNIMWSEEPHNKAHPQKQRHQK